MDVSNLLLEQCHDNHHNSTDSAAIHAASGNQNGAVFPTTTLPAIRPLHEDQLFDTRPYTNEIDSLTLPEIDWQALTASFNSAPPPPAVNGLKDVVYGALSLPQVTVSSTRAVKSSAPIAEVLNQASPPVTKHAQTAKETPEENDAHKRRKIDPPALRTLPKPSPASKQQKSNKRNLLPPLLVPLHEPPPDAGLIPSMTTEGIPRRIEQVDPRRDVQEEASHTVQLVTTKQPAETTTAKNTQAGVGKVAPNTKGRRIRHTWDENETSDLLRGVAKFGIGNWKRILEHDEYHFQNRTAVDLKDRFRTCCPQEYRNVGSNTGKPLPPKKTSPKVASDEIKVPSRKKSDDAQGTEKHSKFEHKLPDELARLGIESFPKAQRRTRRGFTAAEDAAILKGFEKYGARWIKIQSDPALGLESRSRTDLRDRFRNKFPEKFVETGHKLKQKDALLNKDHEEEFTSLSPSISSRPSSTVHNMTAETLNTTSQATTILQAPLPRLLINQPSLFEELGDITPDIEESGPITLSRNIFDWADQNAPRAEPMVPVFDFSNTISTLDQYNMNPMLALKAPLHATTTALTHGVAKENAVGAAPPNLFPQLPLSNILNGPVSLPSAAELMSGMEEENSM